ncbi:MAG: hypothetical protein SCM88_03520 [Bacillota bacterium]|nr:hypothetical protein [Bacillota bacterium]
MKKYGQKKRILAGGIEIKQPGQLFGSAGAEPPCAAGKTLETKKEVSCLGKKVIPFHKAHQPSTTLTETLPQSQLHLKASGEATQIRMAEYFREEAKRVRTVALLMEVAETICREEAGSKHRTEAAGKEDRTQGP